MCNDEYPSRNFGISWTDKEEIAKKYVFYTKNNNKDSDGKITFRIIERSDVFAVWGINGKEKDLIIPRCTR